MCVPQQAVGIDSEPFFDEVRTRFLNTLRRSSAVPCFLYACCTSPLAHPNPVPNENIPQFTLSEEPLGLPALEGFGYFRAAQDSRFKILIVVLSYKRN